MRNSKMKILLAGGCGYIGTELARKIISKNYKVDIVDLLYFGNNISTDNVNVYKKNIFDLKDNDIKKYDCVIFLAGLSNDPMAEFNPSMNFIENTSSPLYLAYLCKKNGINRFIFASSCSVYGFTSGEEMYETDIPSPSYPYGISKLAAETAIMNMTSTNFHPICLRKGTVGGYSDRMRFDLVVNSMTKNAITKGYINVDNPNIWRPIIDIRDVCDAYIKCLEADYYLSGIYNILENNYTIGKLSSIIKDTLDKLGYKIEMNINTNNDVRNYKANSTKAKKDLNFIAKYSPQDTVLSIIDRINKNEDLNSNKYYNIKVFKELF